MSEKAKQAIEKYTEKFGGYPYFMMMGAEDEVIIKEVEKALKTGKEIEIDMEGKVF